MPKINYIEPNGTEHDGGDPVGWSVMEGAVQATWSPASTPIAAAPAPAPPAMSMSMPAWAAKLPPKSDMEETMLDFAQDAQAQQPPVLPVAGDVRTWTASSCACPPPNIRRQHAPR